MHATLIHNPTAGVEKPSKEEIIQALLERGYETNYFSSKEDGLKEALRHPGELVIVAGGDGTVAKVAKHMVGRKIPIGILSTGTANNIAATLKACGLPQLEISHWNLSNRFPYDVGRARGSWGETQFIESAGFGLLTDLMVESEQIQKRRKLSFEDRSEKIQFGISVLRDILRKQTASFYHLQLDGKDLSGKYLLVEIMNIKSVGPNLTLAPEATPGDGQFDVVLLSEGEKEHFVAYLNNIENGKTDAFIIKTFRASHISIHSEQTRLHLDDEIFEAEENSPIKITLEAHKLEFL